MKTAVAAVAVPHAIATFVRFWRLRHHVDKKVVRTFGAVNAAGALGGALLQGYVNNTALSAILGLLLVIVGLANLIGVNTSLRVGGSKAAWVDGLVSGAFGGLVGNQGGIRAAALLGFGMDGLRLVATATAIGLAVDAARLPVYLFRGVSEIAAVWPVILIATAGVIAGTLAGEGILRRIPQHLYRRVVAGLLTALGVFILF
jgi:uncharacterized membrane protein YfcA